MKYLKLIRPQHWIKNFFVLIPMFFGGELFDFEQASLSAVGRVDTVEEYAKKLNLGLE